MLLQGDCILRLKELPDNSVDCCVTSPPYWGLRDYGVTGQLGQEKTPEEYIQKMVEVFSEVMRVLKPSGTLWLNLGDSYAGGNRGGNSAAITGKSKDASKVKRERPHGLSSKNLVGIPWRVALALQSSGWILRQDIIWAKPNAMPESVTDRCTKSHEYIFLLSKSAKYHFDSKSIQEPSVAWGKDRRTDRKRENGVSTENAMRVGKDSSVGISKTRNKRSVWTVTTKSFKGAHFATFPPDLIEPCILAGCPKGGTVLDPFFGAGTTGLVSQKLKRKCIGIELNPEYLAIAEKRMAL